jgi:addiction module RelE/StbE family toxin
MDGGWKVLITPSAQKAMDKAPRQVLEKYAMWSRLIREWGPQSVRVHRMPGFKDHALVGNWAGFRSSYLNRQYRVIYSIAEQNRCVTIERIGPHDY